MTRRLLATTCRAAIVLTFGCCAITAARADHEIFITESGGPTIPIVDDGPLDADTFTPGGITVNTSALNLLLVNFSFAGLSSASNSLTGTPGSNDLASLLISGMVSRTTTGGPLSITIQSFDTDYLFPSGNPRTMTTSASDTFRFTTAGDQRTFQSLFDPGNLTPPGPGIPSPLLAFVPPVGTGPFATGNSADTAIGAPVTPFGLSNTTVITLGGSSSPTAEQSDQFGGATTVHVASAVPEPATLPFLLSSGCAAAFAFRRSRRSK